MRHEKATRILAEVIGALGKAGIPVLPVKGIVTAHVLYQDVADRPMGDIDLRLRIRDFGRAIAVARAKGWQTFDDTPRLWEGGIRIDGWEVEIECTIGPPGLCATTVDELLERAEPRAAPSGLELLEPELNDHALILCANAFKDLLRVVPWALEDLLRIARHPDFDPSLVVERARRGRMTTALWIVADWLASEHSSAGWRAVRDRIGPRPGRRRYAAAFNHFATGSSSPRLALLVTASGCDSPVYAVRGLALAAFGAARGALRRRLF